MKPIIVLLLTLTGCASVAPAPRVDTTVTRTAVIGARQTSQEAAATASAVGTRVNSAKGIAGRLDAKASVLLEHWY